MPIPVFVITGFLGSGKTTLVNALLRDPAFSETAVLINEFGDVAVDHDLVTAFSDELITTTTGCLCCTASSDIKQSLFELWRKRKDREIGPFRRVVVETTGLLDPAPLINALLTPHAPGLVDNVVKHQFALSRVITLFDAETGGRSLQEFSEARRQVGFADLVVLTKTDTPFDHAAGDENPAGRIASINPGARLLDRHRDWDAVRTAFLEPGTYDLRSKDDDVFAWLEADRAHAAEHDDHAHHRHHLDVTRHDDDVRSHVIIIDNPVAGSGLRRLLQALKETPIAELLRLKGLVALREDPERPVVVHGVRHLVQANRQLDEWPGEDRRTRLVLIGRDLDVDALKALLQEDIRHA